MNGAPKATLGSLDTGFVNNFVDGTVSQETLNYVRHVATVNPPLQRAGFQGGLQFIDTGASTSKYVSDLHGILLEAAEDSVPRGTLAEELQHAIDYSAGLHSPQRIASMQAMYGANFNDVWHQGVFNRIADTLESSDTSIFHYFLDENDAAGFRAAAEALGNQ
jgi:hypothetical protein